MCIAIACFPGCDVINFEINLILSNQAVFLHDQKCLGKNSKILRMKGALRRNKKYFSSLLKGFQLLKIVHALRVTL